MQGAASGTNLTTLDPKLEELLDKQAERPVFLRSAWLMTWLSEFGGDCDALMLTAGDNGITGLAPLMRIEDRLTFIGDPAICDYMDVLVDTPSADVAYTSLWQQICSEDWSDLDLWGLMESSSTRERIASLGRASGCSVEEEVEAVAPRLTLPESWEDYLASLGKKDRHELRRKIRRLFDSGAGVDLQVLSSQSEVAGVMDDFLELHTRSRQDKTDFMTAEMADFFRRMASAMAAEDLVRLFMLRINNRPAAAVLCFVAGSFLYLYNSGYDPEFSSLSVGLVSKALCLRWAIENGFRGLDFLRGDESYKYDLGAQDQRVYRLRLSRPV